MREGTFHGLVRIADEDIDARPSDALNLAVRTGAPILAEAAFPAGELPVQLEARQQEFHPQPESGDWRSLSPELVLASWKPR